MPNYVNLWPLVFQPLHRQTDRHMGSMKMMLVSRSIAVMQILMNMFLFCNMIITLEVATVTCYRGYCWTYLPVREINLSVLTPLNLDKLAQIIQHTRRVEPRPCVWSCWATNTFVIITEMSSQWSQSVTDIGGSSTYYLPFLPHSFLSHPPLSCTLFFSCEAASASSPDRPQSSLHRSYDLEEQSSSPSMPGR